MSDPVPPRASDFVAPDRNQPLLMIGQETDLAGKIVAKPEAASVLAATAASTAWKVSSSAPPGSWLVLFGTGIKICASRRRGAAIRQ